MIKLVVSDVDGTLIKPGETRISEKTLSLLGELKEKGVLFAVASGRDYDDIRPLFGKIKNDIIYITNNGGVVMYQGKVLCKTPIDKMLSVTIMNEMQKKRDCRVLLAGETGSYVSTYDTDFTRYLAEHGFSTENVKDFKEVKEPITKISIYAKYGLTEEFYESIVDRWGDKIKIAISGNNWVDLTDEYVNKGNALAVVQHIFEVTSEDTVTFGDNYNDVEMFERSYYSYAMQHSPSDIRKCAKHITPDVDSILEDILRM